MMVEMMKWQIDPHGGIYRVIAAIQDPISDKFYSEIQRVECIWDYSKRSESTRYEIRSIFYQLYLDPQDKTEQQILNSLYSRAILLDNERLNIQIDIQDNEISHKGLTETEIEKKHEEGMAAIKKFRFKRNERTFRSSSPETLAKLMDMDIDMMELLPITSPY